LQAKKKKTLDKTIPFFNGVYIGQFNKKNLPNGKGHVMCRSMDENHPEDTDMFFGEFFNGTKTGLGKYTFFSGRNIAQHAFTIPTYTGEWSSDNFHGLGSMIIDKFEDIHIYEGEFRNNKVFGFGKMTFNPTDGTPDTEYFIELGYKNVTEAAIVAPNFRGIGLPTYLWKQVVNLLYHTSASALTEITCDATNGGICVLQGSCSSYASIWTYSFKIMFSDETNNNYINMPLGALAADQNGACNLYIQFLDETEQP